MKSTMSASIHVRKDTHCYGEHHPKYRSVDLDGGLIIFLPMDLMEAREFARELLRALQTACGGSV